MFSTDAETWACGQGSNKGSLKQTQSQFNIHFRVTDSHDTHLTRFPDIARIANAKTRRDGL